jgi:dTDP-4-dehydrorhamnose 3,5-epimerase
MAMRVVETDLPGVWAIEPVVHRDARGFLVETYHAQRYAAAGIRDVFVQDNHSKSVRGTIRGLHMQVTALQAKLVRVVAGEIFDVAVDVRLGSPTFSRWTGVTLSADTAKQLYVPPGFAHGFAVMSETAEVEYKCSAFYDPTDEIAIRFDDPAIGIRWPIASPMLSARDAAAATLAELRDRLPPCVAV